MTTLLLKNILLDGRTTNILIKDGLFADLNAAADAAADSIYDASGEAIVPSFFNTHTHAAMTLLRGYADDMELFTWLNDHIWPFEAKMTAQDIYNGSRLAVLEMIRSGTTFFCDMYWMMEETAKAVEEMGIRAALGVTLIALWLHDTPESKGLPPVEVLAGEKTGRGDTHSIHKSVLKNPGVWILALSSAFMYMSRYAINEWGMFFLQKNKGFELLEASSIIAVNTIAGILGTVCGGWISDTLFKGDRKWPALTAGILESVSLVLFLYGGDGWAVNIAAMVLFGISIGVLICFVGGLMAVDLVPRKATGAALGIVGLASYAAAGLMNIISGWLIDGQALIDETTGEVIQYDFTYVSVFWVGAAVVSFLLPVLNWKRKKPEE